MEDQIIIRIDTKDKEAGQKAAELSNRSLSDYVRLVLAEAVKTGKKV